MNNYRRTKKRLKLYAKSFCREVKRELPGHITTCKYPKIYCFREEGLNINNDLMDGLYIDGKVIQIYDILRKPLSELKMTVRHECLHFLLYESGLPHDDKDMEFLALAYLYKADPYELLDESTMETFIKTIKQAVKDLSKK